jgi:hypothetical protein
MDDQPAPPPVSGSSDPNSANAGQLREHPAPPQCGEYHSSANTPHSGEEASPPLGKDGSPGAAENSLTKAFKNWAQGARELSHIPLSPTEVQQNVFLAGIKDSPNPSGMAFEVILWLYETRERLRKHSWLKPHMLEILELYPQALDPNDCSGPGELAKWVQQKLEPLQNATDWSDFVRSSRHFAVLCMILLPTRAKRHLTEAIAAFNQCAIRCSGKHGGEGSLQPDANAIRALIRRRIPTRADLPKDFRETLAAIHAVSDMSAELMQENKALASEVDELRLSLRQEIDSLEKAEKSVADLETKLQTANLRLREVQACLETERNQRTTQREFQSLEKDQTAAHVISVVRQGVNQKLKDIREYADRANPNRDEILSLLKEIEYHVETLEEKIRR